MPPASGSVTWAACTVSDCGCLYFPPDHRLPAKYGLGAAALRYAALGFAVIPLARGGKRPHAMLGNVGGVHLASKDPDIIMDWWGLDMMANIGVATGCVNRLAVVDLDVKGGKDGIRAWGDFLSGPPPAPWPCWNGPKVMTPSGGMHLWLRSPDGVTVPERPGILPGVDIKGDGGLVVAAPSMALVTPLERPGERSAGEVPVPYELASGCPHDVPEYPEWLGRWAASAPPAPRGSVTEHSAADRMPLDETLETYVRSGLPVGQRNRELYRVACGLYRRYGTGTQGAAQAIEVIRGIYDKTDKSGFPWREALVCAESARRFVEGQREREDARDAQFLGWLSRRHR